MLSAIVRPLTSSEYYERQAELPGNTATAKICLNQIFRFVNTDCSRLMCNLRKPWEKVPSNSNKRKCASQSFGALMIPKRKTVKRESWKTRTTKKTKVSSWSIVSDLKLTPNWAKLKIAKKFSFRCDQNCLFWNLQFVICLQHGVVDFKTSLCSQIWSSPLLWSTEPSFTFFRLSFVNHHEN